MGANADSRGSFTLSPESLERPEQPTRRGLMRSAVVPLALLAMACGGDEVTPTVSFRVVSPPLPASDGTCPSRLASAELTPLSFAGAAEQPDRVRITYLASATGGLICDKVFDFTAENRSVVAVPSSEPVDLIVEFFDSSGQTLAIGRAQQVQLSNSDGSGPGQPITVDIPAQLTEAFDCANTSLATPRAFHSATALPGGEVLIIGGAVASPAGGSELVAENGLFATNSVEIYQPATGVFTAVPVNGPPLLARAMHEAYVVSSDTDGSATIAVIGGVTSSDPALPALVFNQNGLRLAPSATAIGVNIQVLSYRPGTGTQTPVLNVEATVDASAAVPLAGHTDPASANPGTQLVGAGGATLVGQALTLANGITAYDPVGRVATAATLVATRVGPTATDLGNGTVLVWGGQLDDESTVGEVISNLAAEQVPTSQAVTPAGATVAIVRGFHNAVRVGSGPDVLIAGGFAMAEEVGNVPAEPVFERLTIAGTADAPTVAVTAITPPNDTIAAGFMATAVLPDGDAVITGGSPLDCPDDTTGIACAVTDSYRYELDSGQLLELPKTMHVARYGHRMTAVGGQLLVSGGIHAAPGLFQTSSAVEALNISDPSADAVTSLMRDAGQVATRDNGTARAPCDVVATGQSGR
ncbi:MAG: hypothetical protein MJE77_23490 [Proteobacteria bacterium]|nr:hypothetical protein [Pseudomonadota bacterium]